MVCKDTRLSKSGLLGLSNVNASASGLAHQFPTVKRTAGSFFKQKKGQMALDASKAMMGGVTHRFTSGTEYEASRLGGKPAQ